MPLLVSAARCQFDVRITTATTATANNNSNSDSNSNSNSSSTAATTTAMKTVFAVFDVTVCCLQW
jgi:hypothetical protein